MRQKQQLQIVTKKKSPRKAVETDLTIGIDLGDRWSQYCVLNEIGEIVTWIMHDADLRSRA